MKEPGNQFDLLTSQRKSSLTSEQADTAKQLNQLMGKSIADRYIDFCRLSAGDFDLRVESPMAAHALRELDSIFRETLAAPMDAKIEKGLAEEQKKETTKQLKTLAFGDAAIDRAMKALEPRVNHRKQIEKIVTRLGVDANGDIAKAWFSVARAAGKAHERPFNRSLKVDDEFRENWAKPFDSVIRGVVIALQAHYSAFAKRVKALAAMSDAAKALDIFEKEIPGAMSLQWLFFRSIEGPRWLPELIKRELVAPHQSRDETDSESGPKYREWPAGVYLGAMAKSSDKTSRDLVVAALRALKESENADVRRDGLEILAALPGHEAALLSDVADAWLAHDDSLLFGGHHAENLLKNIAEANEKTATATIAKAILRVSDADGRLRTHYSQHMYEHSLPKTTDIITKALGLEALQLLNNLLYEVGVIEGKIKLDPFYDYTSVISGPLPQNQSDTYDVFGALVSAVRQCAVELITKNPADTKNIISILTAKKLKISRRLALHVLSRAGMTAPELADEFLFDEDALDSYSLRYEYAELALARFPQLSKERQSDLLTLIDKLPAKYETAWRKRFEDHEKRPPNDDDVRTYEAAVVRDAVWYWREVLPADRQNSLNQIVAKIGDPDAWKNKFASAEESSPKSATDFAVTPAKEVAEYLRNWKPDPENKETKTAQAFELYKAVQADSPRFAEDALAFADLLPVYVRRFFEGLRHPAQNKGAVGWKAPLELLDKILSRIGNSSPDVGPSDGDDPSWFWAAKEGAEFLRAGLQLGKEGVEFENAPQVSAIIAAIEKLAPATPEDENFEKKFAETPYFAAEATMAGLAAELRVLELFWLSKHEGSFTFGKSREAIKSSPDFDAFAQRVLADKQANGRIVRAIFGRYLGWLYHFGEDWTKQNFKLLFPDEKPLRDAAWLGHLINGGGPIIPLMEYMAPAYEAENEHLLHPKSETEKDWRQDRYGEYVLLEYVWGDFPPKLLEQFLANAPPRVRSHAMWFLGRIVRENAGKMSPEILAKALRYWEMRIAAAEVAPDKEHFQQELGGIGNWLHDYSLDPKWMIQQLVRMLRAGFGLGHGAYGAVEWAAKICDGEPEGAVDILLELFKSPKTDQWAYMTNQPATRRVLETGIATGNPAIKSKVEQVISILVSRGDASFLDLSAES
jgi:hypothetical protein